MWHEMRNGSRANGYLINVRPDCRARAHLLHVPSNMHDLQAGFWTENFLYDKKIDVRRSRKDGKKHSAETLWKKMTYEVVSLMSKTC